MKFIQLLLILFPTALWSQGWFDGDPIWEFSANGCGDLTTGHERILYVGDTVIDGQTMQKFAHQHNTNSYGDITIWEQLLIMYEVDDMVYEYSDTGSRLLYDFTYNQGDTVKVQVLADPQYCDTILCMVLDTIEIRQIAGQELRAQVWRPTNNLEYDSSKAVIIEKVGNIKGHFLNGMGFDLRTCLIADACPPYSFTCYQNSLGNYPGSCPDITSLKETKPNSITLFPNPTEGLLHIESDREIQQIKIYTRLGQLVLTSTKNEFSLDDLPPGIYFVHILTREGGVIKPVVKQ